MSATPKPKRRAKTAAQTKARRAAAARPALGGGAGEGIRFHFDFHGLRSTYVPVQDADTDDASNLIAAAIHRAWAQSADDDS